METRWFSTDSAESTRELGKRVGRLLAPGTCVLLRGPLGAGKTTFAQGLARGLGVVEQVVSPTFVLIREYPRADGGRLVHVDLYRVSSREEALDLGLDDYLAGDDIVVVEWPENAPDALPDRHVLVVIGASEPAAGADSRAVTVAADEGLIPEGRL